jgi:hypothetical protein
MARLFGSPHRKALLVANAAVFAFVGIAFGIGGTGEAAPVLRAPLGTDAQRLESQAALEPTSANVAALADTYLDRGQPGLAVSLLDRHAADGPETQLARGRALYASGHAKEALSTIEDLLADCEERVSPSAPCATWVVIKGIHERAFFEEMVRSGIDDAALDPEATQAAFERSRRQMGLVAVR